MLRGARKITFAHLAAELDRAEAVADGRAGGPTKPMQAAVEKAESALQSAAPASAADFHWIAQRLARAAENCWSTEAVRPLIELARQPEGPVEPPAARVALTIPEVAAAIGISSRSVWREVAAGNLAARKRGSSTLILAADLDAYLAGLPSHGAC